MNKNYKEDVLMATVQSNHLFNPNPINFANQPLFLGEGLLTFMLS